MQCDDPQVSGGHHRLDAQAIEPGNRVARGRGVCPGCSTRWMVETAAHLADHVFPRLPVRQWLLSVPKRLRYPLEHDPAIETLPLRIFLSG